MTFNTNVSGVFKEVSASDPFMSGGTLTSDATYYYRTFTSVGVNELTMYGYAPFSVDYLIVGGGGRGSFVGATGSGFYSAGEGGGAGGVVTGTTTLSAGCYPFIVGAGGQGASASYELFSEPSSALGITALKGGDGFGTLNRNNGGSGAGANTSLGPIGTGQAGQGNNGALGFGSSSTASTRASGGGGGKNAAGSAAASSVGGSGGAGGTFLGLLVGGGGGGAGPTRGTGGTGGGGNGAQGPSAGASGTTNTGGGGGGAYSANSAAANGGNGGSGVIRIRYLRTSVGG